MYLTSTNRARLTKGRDPIYYTAKSSIDERRPDNFARIPNPLVANLEQNNLQARIDNLNTQLSRERNEKLALRQEVERYRQSSERFENQCREFRLQLEDLLQRPPARVDQTPAQSIGGSDISNIPPFRASNLFSDIEGVRPGSNLNPVGLFNQPGANNFEQRARELADELDNLKRQFEAVSANYVQSDANYKEMKANYDRSQLTYQRLLLETQRIKETYENKMQAERNVAQSEALASKNKIIELDRKIKNYDERILELQNREKQYIATTQDLSNQLRSLQNQLVQKEHEMQLNIQQLKNEAEQFGHAQDQEARSRIAENINVFNQRIRQQADEISQLQRNIQNLTEENMNLVTNNAILKKTIDDQINDLKSLQLNNENLRNSYQNQISMLNQQKFMLQIKENEQNELINKYNVQLIQNEESIKNLEEAYRRNEYESNEKISELKNLINQREYELSNNKNLSSQQQNSYNQEINMLKNKLDGYDKYRLELEGKINEQKNESIQQRSKVDSLNNEIQRLNNLLGELKIENATIYASYREKIDLVINNHNNQVESYRNDIYNLKDLNDQLTNELAKEKLKNEQSVKVINELNQNLVNLRSVLDKKSNDYEILENKINAEKNEIKSLLDALTRIHVDLMNEYIKYDIYEQHEKTAIEKGLLQGNLEYTIFNFKQILPEFVDLMQRCLFLFQNQIKKNAASLQESLGENLKIADFYALYQKTKSEKETYEAIMQKLEDNRKSLLDEFEGFKIKYTELQNENKQIREQLLILQQKYETDTKEYKNKILLQRTANEEATKRLMHFNGMEKLYKEVLDKMQDYENKINNKDMEINNFATFIRGVLFDNFSKEKIKVGNQSNMETQTIQNVAEIENILKKNKDLEKELNEMKLNILQQFKTIATTKDAYVQFEKPILSSIFTQSIFRPGTNVDPIEEEEEKKPPSFPNEDFEDEDLDKSFEKYADFLTKNAFPLIWDHFSNFADQKYNDWNGKIRTRINSMVLGPIFTFPYATEQSEAKEGESLNFQSAYRGVLYSAICVDISQMCGVDFYTIIEDSFSISINFRGDKERVKRMLQHEKFNFFKGKEEDILSASVKPNLDFFLSTLFLTSYTFELRNIVSTLGTFEDTAYIVKFAGYYELISMVFMSILKIDNSNKNRYTPFACHYYVKDDMYTRFPFFDLLYSKWQERYQGYEINWPRLGLMTLYFWKTIADACEIGFFRTNPLLRYTAGNQPKFKNGIINDIKDYTIILNAIDAYFNHMFSPKILNIKLVQKKLAALLGKDQEIIGTLLNFLKNPNAQDEYNFEHFYLYLPNGTSINPYIHPNKFVGFADNEVNIISRWNIESLRVTDAALLAVSLPTESWNDTQALKEPIVGAEQEFIYQPQSFTEINKLIFSIKELISYKLAFDRGYGILTTAAVYNNLHNLIMNNSSLVSKIATSLKKRIENQVGSMKKSTRSFN